MAKIIFEGDPEEFAKLFRITESDRRQEAELTLLRIYAMGNPNQSTLFPSPPPPPPPPPPPQPAEQFLLPPSPSTLIQDLPPQVPTSKFPKITKIQQKGIAITAAIALSLWILDAIAPGILGKSLDGALSLIQREPISSPPTPAPTPGVETEVEVSPENRSLIDRIREAQEKPVAPEGG